MSSTEVTENKVEYRQLGKSGLNVSVPILGAMSFGSSEWQPWVLNEAESLPIMKAAWDKGINTIDTANIYSNGYSEMVVAAFIEKYQIPRNEIVIATKANGKVGPKPHFWNDEDYKPERDYINQSGLSRVALFNAVDASLARLKTSYIDLLQIHRYDSKTTAEETMKALHDLVQNGKVRYIGASSMRTWQFAHLNEVAERNGWTKFVSMQDEYSLLYREEEREMFKYCEFNGIGVIPWSPLAFGVLARPFGTETLRQTKGSLNFKLSSADEITVNRVEEIAKKKGWSMAQVALTWINKKVTSPIVGVNSIQRMEESVVNGLSLSEDEIKYLEEPYVPKKVRGHA